MHPRETVAVRIIERIVQIKEKYWYWTPLPSKVLTIRTPLILKPVSTGTPF
jgi:hypothetical protein